VIGEGYMLKFIKNLFTKKPDSLFSVEIIRHAQERKTKWDKIAEMDIPSCEKIKLVKIQKMPLSGGEQFAAKKKSIKYTIKVSPQKPEVFEYDDSQAVTVYVLASSKTEALNTLSMELANKRAFIDNGRNNNGTSGRWYDGNNRLMEIIGQEKAATGRAKKNPNCTD
jgi:hypothetical protein